VVFSCGHERCGGHGLLPHPRPAPQLLIQVQVGHLLLGREVPLQLGLVVLREGPVQVLNVHGRPAFPDHPARLSVGSGELLLLLCLIQQFRLVHGTGGHRRVRVELRVGALSLWPAIISRRLQTKKKRKRKKKGDGV
jgi:hypothetical protein